MEPVVIPEGATLQQIHDAVGGTEEPAEDELEDGVPFEQLHLPRIHVERVFAVICQAAACNGIVAARTTREQANAAHKAHRDIHLTAARRAEAILAKFRKQGGLENKDLRPSIQEAEPEKPPYYDMKDNGFLDWQYGSESTGRDPMKMWHRGCGGEVIVIEATNDPDWVPVRMCSSCGKADTSDGTLSGARQ